MKNKNNSIRKIITTIIATLMIVVSCIVIKSFADSQYQLVRYPDGRILVNDYAASYCLNWSHACRTAGPRPADPLNLVCTTKFYKTYIDVNGMHFKYNSEAAHMAWMAMQGGDTSTYTAPDPNRWDNCYVISISPMQYATWRYANAFLRSTLYGVGTDIPLVLADAYGLSPSGTAHDAAISDEQIGAENVNQINAWGNAILGDTVSTTINKADGYSEDIKFQMNGRSYVKIGPLTMTYGGDATDLATYTKNGEKLNSEFYKYVGNQLSQTGYTDPELKSGGAFYILLPKDDETNKRLLRQGIQNVKITTQGGNPLPENDEQGNPPTIRWFQNVQPDASVHHQDHAVYTAGYWTPTPKEASVDIGIDVGDSIIIRKYGLTKNENGEEVVDQSLGMLGGAKFRIYCKAKDGKTYTVQKPRTYLLAQTDSKRDPSINPDDGTHGYDPTTGTYTLDFYQPGESKDDITLFETKNGLPIILENLMEGDYTVEEVEPPPGYELSNNDGAEGGIGRISIPLPNGSDGEMHFHNRKKKGISIKKFGLKEDGTVDSDAGILQGARFIIRRIEEDKVEYIKHDSGYNWNEHNSTYEVKEDDYVEKSEINEEDLKKDSQFTFTNIAGQALFLTGLKDGEYEVEEVIPPPGYALSKNGENDSNIMKFKIPDDEEKEIHFHNEKTEGTGITINKYGTNTLGETDTNDRPGGAKILIKYKREEEGQFTYFLKPKTQGTDDGTSIRYNESDIEYVDIDNYNENSLFTTVKDRNLVFDNLSEGYYEAEEIKAPEGYVEDFKTHDFELPKDDGNHYDIVNDKEDTVKIQKNGYEEIRGEPTEKIALSWTTGNTESIQANGPTAPLDKDHHWYEQYKIYRIHQLKDDPEARNMLNEFARKIKDVISSEKWTYGCPGAYGTKRVFDSFWDHHNEVLSGADHKYIDCSTYVDYVFADFSAWYNQAHPGAHVDLRLNWRTADERWCPNLYDNVGGVMTVRAEPITNLNKDATGMPLNLELGDLILFGNHIQIFAGYQGGEAPVTINPVENIGGAGFAIKNVETNEYVKVPQGADRESSVYNIEKEDYMKIEPDRELTEDDDALIFYTVEDKEIEIKGLKRGTYKVIEVVAPAGYELKEKESTFTIPSTESDTIPVVVDDGPDSDDGGVRIRKSNKEDSTSDKVYKNTEATWYSWDSSTMSLQMPIKSNRYKPEEAYGFYRAKGVSSSQMIDAAKKVWNDLRGFRYGAPENQYYEDYDPHTGYVWGSVSRSREEHCYVANSVTYLNFVLNLVGRPLPSNKKDELSARGGISMYNSSNFEWVDYNDLQPGDIGFWNGHMQIFAGWETGDTVTEVDSAIKGDLLSGAVFVVRNTETQEYVKNSANYNEDDKGTKRGNNGAYYIGKQSYVKYEEAYNASTNTYSEEVQFTTEQGKELVLKKLKPGKYEVEEIIPPPGYNLSTNDVQSFTIEEQEEDPKIYLNFGNKQQPEGTFRKIIEGTEKNPVGLENFEFELRHHTIFEEYDEIINRTVYPEVYVGTKGDEHKYYPQPSVHYVVAIPHADGSVTYRCSCGKGSGHAAKWNSERAAYNAAVFKANLYHNTRDRFVNQINSRRRTITSGNYTHEQKGIVTDKQGYGDIDPLASYLDDYRGIIDIVETSVGGNPYFNLLEDDDKTERKEQLRYHDDHVMTNERKRMDIEGYIWEDLGQTKDNSWDSIQEDNEPYVQPIEVNLKYKNQKIADGVVTGDGKYRIRVGDHDGSKLQYLTNKTLAKDTYIEFTYNGVVFQCVKVNLNEAHGSKAEEKEEDRERLIDDPYSTIYANDGKTSVSEGAPEGATYGDERLSGRKSTEIKYWRNSMESQGSDQYADTWRECEEEKQNRSETRYEGSVSGALTRSEKEAETTGDIDYTVESIPQYPDNLDTKYTDQEYPIRDDANFVGGCYTITGPFGARKERSVDNTKYQITATTLEAEFQEFNNYTVAQDRIINVNLGLRRREEPDLAVVNDIYQVRIEYDGHKYTYQYGKKMRDADKDNDGNLDIGGYEYKEGNDTPYFNGEFDVGVKFKNERKGYYYREVYPSDIEIIPTSQRNRETNTKELNIYVTYKTSIFNESTNLRVKPLGIINQYDSRYIGYYKDPDVASSYTNLPKDVTKDHMGENVGYGVDWKKEGNTCYGAENRSNNKNLTKPGEEDIYQQAYGKIDTFIDPQSQIFIFTEYRLARQQCLDLLEGKDEIKTTNHMEINAYTTQKDGKNYGHIDKDSHPGNMVPEYEMIEGKEKYCNDSYEDDNDDAPIFTLKLAEGGNRVLKGNVFKDISEIEEDPNSNSDEAKYTTEDGRIVKERKANGKNDDGTAIENVQVQLMEVDKYIDNTTGVETWIDSGRVAKLDMPKYEGTELTDTGSGYDPDNRQYLESRQSSGWSQNSGYYSENESKWGKIRDQKVGDLGDSSTGYWNTLDQLRDATTLTDDHGNYCFYGYAPGRYLIKYTWGQNQQTKIKVLNADGTVSDADNPEVNAQQYKSTVFGEYNNDGNKARVETPEITPGQERYKKYLEYQTNNDNKPQRWYLYEILGEQNNSNSKKYSHKNLSNAIDEISRIDKTDSTWPEDGNLKENENGQRELVDGRLMDIDNTNNYNNYMNESYNANWPKPATDKNIPTADEDPKNYNNFNEYKDDSKLREMYSRTVSFDIGVECLWDDNDATTDEKTGESDKREFEIHNMDFGITERPNMNLQIKKEIENVKVLLANGDTLINANVVNNQISGPVPNTKYLKPDKNDTGAGSPIDNIGALHIEMDTELMHGATVQITYRYTILNTSELDYNLELEDYGEKTARETNGNLRNVYYKFGDYEPDSQEVTMTATKVVDYMDNKLNYDETLENQNPLHPYGSDNQLWLRNEITTEDGKGLYDNHEVLQDVKSKEAVDNANSEVGKDITTEDIAKAIKKGYWTITRGEHGAEGDEREQDNGGALHSNVSSTFHLTATKALSNTTEDMSYFNSAEIIKIRKTGGEYPGELAPSPLENKLPTASTTPGNLIPIQPGLPEIPSPLTTVAYEPDSWTAEQVTITPPTGDDKEYLMTGWTIIGIVSLGVLGSGVIAIKNAVKRKKNDN